MEKKDMTIDQKIDEVLKIIQEQGDRHDRRFDQIDGQFAQIDDRFTQLETRLTAKIDMVYEALSQDITVFAEDLYELKDRIDRPEKKPLS